MLRSPALMSASFLPASGPGFQVTLSSSLPSSACPERLRDDGDAGLDDVLLVVGDPAELDLEDVDDARHRLDLREVVDALDRAADVRRAAHHRAQGARDGVEVVGVLERAGDHPEGVDAALVRADQRGAGADRGVSSGMTRPGSAARIARSL